jgi:hypothetical protein
MRNQRAGATVDRVRSLIAVLRSVLLFASHPFEDELCDVRFNLAWKPSEDGRLNELILTGEPFHKSRHHSDLRHAVPIAERIQLLFGPRGEFDAHDKSS